MASYRRAQKKKDSKKSKSKKNGKPASKKTKVLITKQPMLLNKKKLDSREIWVGLVNTAFQKP